MSAAASTSADLTALQKVLLVVLHVRRLLWLSLDHPMFAV